MEEKNFILNESNYEIRKTRFHRKQAKNIILVPIRYFYEEGTPIEPLLKIGSIKYTWNRWQYYFYKVLRKFELPFHYYIEQVNNDFDIHVAHPEFAPSYFIDELCDNKVIDLMLKNSIVIAMGEDFSIDIAERRFYQQLAYRLLVPLFTRNLKYIDEFHINILDKHIDWNTLNKVKQEKILKYDIVPSIYYDDPLLKLFFRKYKTFVSIK